MTKHTINCPECKTRHNVCISWSGSKPLALVSMHCSFSTGDISEMQNPLIPVDEILKDIFKPKWKQSKILKKQKI